ncbi:aldehyde dehydrogenase family protein [Bradyrhizobium hipponense]|uniref:Aldehyde dehydrogenase family protein n=1 Tax=Bradyrhizobium hipponense TaxID=2605638 RepID=A0A5S4YWY2_9BRAD|nr:aldehyde dehydrogenase family protein [Bradyrhizobium hipponense]TYO65669.1 aldehyde dehydrogenase family protein [Bradyrhizobium hipponense]
MQRWGLLIDGRKVETDDFQEVINPSTGSVVSAMPVGRARDLDAAVAAASKAFSVWKEVPDSQRAEACRAIAKTIDAHSEELARLLTLEQGKPMNGLGSRFEIGGAVAWTRYTADLSLPVEVLQDGAEGRVELHRKPIGVVGSITPWNWPVMIACWHIIPAIRAGNTVVIKPSPLTPLSTIRLVELINEELPPGVVNVVTGENEIGSLMSSHPGIAKVTFTGSTATGRKIMQNAAGTLKRLTLELGGNDAGIVLPDAEPKKIVEGLFWGAFINCGQTCAALKRLYVHDSLYDEVCRELTAYAKQVVVGDGLSDSSTLGPVQNRRQFEIVSSFVKEAREKGGRVLIGGDPADGPGWFYPVTLVADVDHGCRLVDEEQFGPALPIIRYSDLDEAVEKANSSSMGLGGSVWGSDHEALKQVAQRIEAGSVWINKHGAIQPNAPFGGVKQSGFGVEFGLEGLKEFTVVQTVFC